MCGIWFSFGRDVSRQVVDIIAHRGPDDADFLKFETLQGPVFMGHRLLSIVDNTPASRQPMEDKTHGLWITYNGEVYNYRDLRKELEGYGHHFKTNTDTEVILKSYVHWGADCLSRFSGMFSFVIYNKNDETIFVARDPFGIKPLYFYKKEGFLAFASEIKQFTLLNDFERRLHKKRVYDFLEHGLFDHSSDTLFNEVKQVRGGECAFISLKEFSTSKNFLVKKWYFLPKPDSIDISFGDAVEQFREKFKQSVKKHSLSEVPMGFCLSGGLDSSSIVCLADSLDQSKDLVSISACYDDRFYDERRFINEVIAKTNCVSHFVFPNEADLLSDIQKVTWHQDEPFGSMSIFAQWSVFKEAHRKGLKVMLDGQGADEQLAGYLFMLPTYMKYLFSKRQYADLISFVFNFSLGDPAFLFQSAKHFFNKNKTARNAIVNKDFFIGNEKDYTPEKEAFAGLKLPCKPDIGSLCSAYVQSIHLPMLLHYEDRNSMAHSIEARVPFLDPSLVELSIGLGNAHKYKEGYTKILLRKAMKDVLPPAIYSRKSKLGFSVPETKWIKGSLKPFVQDSVMNSCEKFPDFFDKKMLMRYLEESLNGSKHFDFTLWRIASLGSWSNVFSTQL